LIIQPSSQVNRGPGSHHGRLWATRAATPASVSQKTSQSGLGRPRKHQWVVGAGASAVGGALGFCERSALEENSAPDTQDKIVSTVSIRVV